MLIVPGWRWARSRLTVVLPPPAGPLITTTRDIGLCPRLIVLHQCCRKWREGPSAERRRRLETGPFIALKITLTAVNGKPSRYLDGPFKSDHGRIDDRSSQSANFPVSWGGRQTRRMAENLDVRRPSGRRKQTPPFFPKGNKRSMFSERWRRFKFYLENYNIPKISTNPCTSSLPYLVALHKLASLSEQSNPYITTSRLTSAECIIRPIHPTTAAWARSRADSIAETAKDWLFARRVRSRR